VQQDKTEGGGFKGCVVGAMVWDSRWSGRAWAYPTGDMRPSSPYPVSEESNLEVVQCILRVGVLIFMLSGILIWLSREKLCL
jgi:hypothetical protein